MIYFFCIYGFFRFLLIFHGLCFHLRTNIVMLQDGLTPLDICLHSGRDIRTYELIKLLKQLPKVSLVGLT